MSFDGLQAVSVKHELEWDRQDNLTEGTGTPLFTPHVVKEELDLGTKQLQPLDDSHAAALYEDHVVKQELVLGPEVLQPRDNVYTLRDPSVMKKEQSAETIKYQAELIKKEGKLGKHNTSLNNVITEFQESTSTQEDLPLKDDVQQNSPERFVVNTSSGETYVWIKVTNFKCNTCEKDFSVWTDVEKHMRTHINLNFTDEKSYKCSQCSAAFNNSYRLQRHLITHTGEKPYKCSQCSSAFSRSNDLRVHHRIHTGEKPFECNICGYKTARSSALHSHIRFRHSGQKPFGCDACSYRGATRGLLRDHLKRFHKLT